MSAKRGRRKTVHRPEGPAPDRRHVDGRPLCDEWSKRLGRWCAAPAVTTDGKCGRHGKREAPPTRPPHYSPAAATLADAPKAPPPKQPRRQVTSLLRRMRAKPPSRPRDLATMALDIMASLLARDITASEAAQAYDGLKLAAAFWEPKKGSASSADADLVELAAALGCPVDEVRAMSPAQLTAAIGQMGARALEPPPS